MLRSTDLWLWAVIISISVVAALMSMDGTMRGWKWAGLDPANPLRFGMPFIAEFSFLMWLLIAEVAVRAERSPYPWWFTAAVTAGVVVALNTAFGGDRPHPYREAAVFGVASAVSLAGAFAKFYLRYIASEVRKGLRSGAKPKLLLNARLIEQPRIRWRAHLIAGRIGAKHITEDGQAKRAPMTVDDAIALADLWREVYQDYRAKTEDGRKGDRQLAKRTAWNAVKERCGATVYKPQTLKVGRVEFVPPPRRPAPEPIETAEEALEAFTREAAAGKPAPKPQRTEPTRRERAVAPTSPAPEGAADIEVDEPDPKLFEIHRERIIAVKNALEGWPNIPAPPSIKFIQEDIARRPEFQGIGLGNRPKASQVAHCIRYEWAQANKAQASK